VLRDPETAGQARARVAGEGLEGASAPARLPPAHWRANLRVTGVLLSLWALVSFGLVFFARELDFDFFGWPFGFWVGAQGAVLAYLAITGFYAGYMRRLDARHGLGDDTADADDEAEAAR
jgi:putative solute:sodium symporter small subunit